jgi:hypothetical protein
MFSIWNASRLSSAADDMSKAIGHELRAVAMFEGFEYAYLRSLESKSRASRPSDVKSRVEAIVTDVIDVHGNNQ